MEVKRISDIVIAVALGLFVYVNPLEGQVFLDEPIAKLGRGTIEDIAYSPDGKLFAVAGSAGIWLYNAKSLTELGLLQGDTGEVTSIAFSPDGEMIASGGVDRSVRLWDVTEGMEITAFQEHTDSVTSVAFSPDGGILASAGEDRTIRLWDVEEKVEIAVLEGHTGPVTSVAFSPDGKTLASAGGAGRSEQENRWMVDGTIRLWDTMEKRQIAVLKGHTEAATSVAFSPDGKILASAGEDSTVRLWDVHGKKEMAVLSHETGRRVQSVAFSPDGDTLAAAEIHSWTPYITRGFGAVRLWDMGSRSEIAELGPTPAGGWSGDGAWAVFSPDGKTLAWATNYNSEVHFCDIVIQEETGVIRGYIGHARPYALSPDGRTLVSGDPGNIRFWNVATGEEMGVQETAFVYICAFSPDG